MRGSKLFLLTILELGFLVVLKIWFINNQIFVNTGVQALVFWSSVGVVTAAMCRRLGVISYLEVFFIMILWTVFGLFADLVITSAFTGLDIFAMVLYWVSMGVMNIVIFLFHKSRHVQVRHDLHAKKHAAAHGHEQKKH